MDRDQHLQIRRMTCLNDLTGFLNFDLFIGTTVIKFLYFAGAFLMPLFIWLVLQRVRSHSPRVETLLSLLAEKTGERIALWLIFALSLFAMEIIWRVTCEYLIAYLQIRQILQILSG